ncbi:telomere recombination domain-containing protein [Ditylenchus destructor]|uniref:Threonylcarbamoyl-AMP synthase n=1 Tax=Ditylenchus destructor TaxID=166010 RepID=A0AAD4MZB1_9BILA|nr:telomere recombination domain-containing protein [Ditylenchus destructor]
MHCAGPSGDLTPSITDNETFTEPDIDTQNGSGSDPEMKRILAYLVPANNKIINAQNGLAVPKARDALDKGKVVAVPTDTLYGLMTRIRYSDRLNRVKGRPKDKPFGLFVNSVEQIQKYSIPTVSNSILKKLLPGPVTVIFERNEQLPASFNPGVNTVGFRIPHNQFVKNICINYSEPLVQTSANVSGSDLSPLCIEDFKELWEDLGLIVDDGIIVENDGSRLGSTVVDLSVEGYYKVVRDGCALQETVKILRSCGLAQLDEKAEAEKCDENG